MKFVFALLLLILLSYLIGFFLPQTYEVTRTELIQGSLEDVHAKVSDLHTWPEWSDFKPPTQEGLGVTPESRFEGPERGEGAIWHWGGLGDIKPARLLIVTSDAGQGITYKLDLDGGRVQTTGVLRYVETEAGVQVTMTNEGEMASPWSRYFSFMADRSIGPTFERSLQGLKTAVESEPANAGAPNGESSSSEDSETESGIESGIESGTEPDPQAESGD